jgi:hypothetical protein
MAGFFRKMAGKWPVKKQNRPSKKRANTMGFSQNGRFGRFSRKVDTIYFSTLAATLGTEPEKMAGLAEQPAILGSKTGHFQPVEPSDEHDPHGEPEKNVVNAGAFLTAREGAKLRGVHLSGKPAKPAISTNNRDSGQQSDPFIRAIALAREAEDLGIDLVDYVRQQAPNLLDEPKSADVAAAKRVARLDAERNARDRKIGRGYDYARSQRPSYVEHASPHVDLV